MVYFTLVTQPNRTSNFVNQLDSGSILKICQSSRFRINTQASSIFSFQDRINLISHLTSRFRNASISLGAPYSVFFVGIIVDVGSIELAVGTPLDPLIFFLLRGSWSFVELTRKPLS
ncbi:hypothetical protein PGTUg99_009840 [Puccinia graminis f. sp. tritici]|uniref:Uncharacterized protein n=1 Tax=Puccinia graminis f. sp. tritici TaxID=56615 RepID=A0A5B0M4H6_PUCGR|nr:hypothetical protein PGTUg99_009840 [Puccinia graminis f. sp. tritici]